MWTCECGSKIGDVFDECPNCGRRRPGATPADPGRLGNLLLGLGQIFCVVTCIISIGAFFVGLGYGNVMVILNSVIGYLSAATFFVVFQRVKKIA